jgi:hypothetical protein
MESLCSFINKIQKHTKMIKCTFDPSFEFNYTHGFKALKNINPFAFYQDKGQTQPDTKYWLFIDMPETILQRKFEVTLAKVQGIKIIAMVYDEARFPLVDLLISQGLVDKLILFDGQYRNRFNIPIFISDYYVNPDVFPALQSHRNGKMCYFGHQLYDRILPQNTDYIKKDTLEEVYLKASQYTKGYVASTGKGEHGGIIHHNKAKFIEMLFCGLKVECQMGINTLNYEHYKNKQITVDDLNSIYYINTRVREELFRQITNI